MLLNDQQLKPNKETPQALGSTTSVLSSLEQGVGQRSTIPVKNTLKKRGLTTHTTMQHDSSEMSNFQSSQTAIEAVARL